MLTERTALRLGRGDGFMKPRRTSPGANIIKKCLGTCRRGVLMSHSVFLRKRFTAAAYLPRTHDKVHLGRALQLATKAIHPLPQPRYLFLHSERFTQSFCR